MFYMVQNDSSANVLESDTDSAPVFFSAFTNRSNADRFAHFQSTTANEREMVIGIEDLVGGGDRDFDDIILSVTPKELVVPGRAGETIATTAIYEGKSAQLDSEIGLVVYDDSSVELENLSPGDAGYARGILTNLTRRLYSRREILVAKRFFESNCPTYGYYVLDLLLSEITI